jgi:23S rRNA (cytosine1962-C5)-methyltransferase
VLAAQRGYEVTHVDASKASIAWTRENAEVSGLAGDAMRIVVDDALGYARREARRGSKYQVVLLDPPHYGRGPKGETWQFEDGIAPLVATVRELIAPRALVILSTYAIGCSPLTFENLLGELGEGVIEAGELALSAAEGGLPLPCGFCARFSRGFE